MIILLFNSARIVRLICKIKPLDIVSDSCCKESFFSFLIRNPGYGNLVDKINPLSCSRAAYDQLGFVDLYMLWFLTTSHTVCNSGVRVLDTWGKFNCPGKYRVRSSIPC